MKNSQQKTGLFKFSQIRLMAVCSLFSMLSLTNCGIAWSQEKKESAVDKNKTTQVIDTENFTPEEKLAIEATALQFAEAQHPELAKLLKNLKQHDPIQYNKGIMEIRRTIVRLDKVRDKSPEKYEREIQLWKVNSQIRLQVARILLTDKQDDHDKLSMLLTDKRQLEIQFLQSELERLLADAKKIEDRQVKMQHELAAKEADVPNWVQQEKERLLKSGKPNLKSGDKSSIKNKPTQKPNASN